MQLTNQEIERYSRHLKLEQVGVEGQQKLKQAKVLVIGAGGLGCPVLQYLSAAGIGTLGIIDFDAVDNSNLQRQILFNTSLIGVNKATAAKEQLEKLNPLISITAYPEKLTKSNAIDLFRKYDIIVDGTDNFNTRYLINDAALLANKPYIYGAIHRFEGQVSVFNYKNGPSYRCLFPNPPQKNTIPSCEQVGVLGVLPGIIGTYQANEVLKIILGIGDVLSLKLMLVNSLNNSTTFIQIKRQEDQIERVINSGKLSDYNEYCESNNSNKSVNSISVEELLNDIDRNKDYVFLDVREPHETPKVNALKGLNIASGEILKNLKQLDSVRKTIVYCQSGVRSRQVVSLLQHQHGFSNLINLEGGIHRWSQTQNEQLTQ